MLSINYCLHLTIMKMIVQQQFNFLDKITLTIKPDAHELYLKYHKGSGPFSV